MSDVIRLVATDLDGTLVHSDGRVSGRTAAALQAVEAAGIGVVFVTGRPLRWTREVFEHVGGLGLAIASNGALVWDVPRDQALLERALDVDTGLQVAHTIRAGIPGSHFAIEQLSSGIALEPYFLERHRVPPGARRGPIEEIFDVPALKLLVRHETLGPQEFWQQVEALVGQDCTITWSSTTTLLEISAKDVTKATTLAQLCDRQGIGAHEVVAFGDMPNDIPLLQWAGTSYAMGNAHPTVKAAANKLAPHHDDDGVAQILEALLSDR